MLNGWRDTGARYWLRVKTARPQEVIAAAAVFLIIVDTFVKPLSLTALGLVLLALAPWLVRIVKSLELPGGFKVELVELEQVANKAEQAGLLAPPTRQDVEPAYRTIFNQDPTLALAGLRIELERRLNRLADAHQLDSRRMPRPVLQTVRELEKNGVLSREQGAVIADLLPLLNRAVHAADYDQGGAQWAMDVGPRLLAALDELMMSNEQLPPQQRESEPLLPR